MCRNTANNICFHYKTNSVKTNDQIFQYIQKTLFLAHFQSIFPNFGTQKFFQKIRLCQAQLHMGFWHHAQIQKKMMIQFQENTWTKVWKDRRTVRSCFIGPFRLMPRVQKDHQWSPSITFLWLLLNEYKKLLHSDNLLSSRYEDFFRQGIKHFHKKDVNLFLLCLKPPPTVRIRSFNAF